MDNTINGRLDKLLNGLERNDVQGYIDAFKDKYITSTKVKESLEEEIKSIFNRALTQEVLLDLDSKIIEEVNKSIDGENDKPKVDVKDIVKSAMDKLDESLELSLIEAVGKNIDIRKKAQKYNNMLVELESDNQLLKNDSKSVFKNFEIELSKEEYDKRRSIYLKQMKFEIEENKDDIQQIFKRLKYIDGVQGSISKICESLTWTVIGIIGGVVPSAIGFEMIKANIVVAIIIGLIIYGIALIVFLMISESNYKKRHWLQAQEDEKKLLKKCLQEK